MIKLLIRLIGIAVIAWVAIDLYSYFTTGSFDSGITLKLWELAKEGFEWFKGLIGSQQTT